MHAHSITIACQMPLHIGHPPWRCGMPLPAARWSGSNQPRCRRCRSPGAPGSCRPQQTPLRSKSSSDVMSSAAGPPTRSTQRLIKAQHISSSEHALPITLRACVSAPMCAVLVDAPTPQQTRGHRTGAEQPPIWHLQAGSEQVHKESASRCAITASHLRPMR